MVKINKIAGVDEVGRGCLAGPVFAAAVILNKSINTKDIKDSKKISFKRRILLSEYIKKNSIHAVGTASVEEINKINKLVFREKNSYLTEDYGKNPSTAYPYPAKLPSFIAQLGLFELERWNMEKEKRKERAGIMMAAAVSPKSRTGSFTSYFLQKSTRNPRDECEKLERFIDRFGYDRNVCALMV